MNIKRTYYSDTVPEEIVVALNATRTASTLILVNTYASAEEGYNVTETADPAPHPATYATLVEAIIALRYTMGEEIAINRLADDDPVKVDYLAFVERAKTAAKEALDADL